MRRARADWVGAWFWRKMGNQEFTSTALIGHAYL